MAIQLDPDQEVIIGRALETGLISDSDDIVDIAVEALRLRLEARTVTNNAMGADEWSQRLHTWVHGHSTASPLLSDESISRESIYAVRGE